MSIILSQSPDVAAQTKALQEQNATLEKEMVELKRQLEEKTLVTIVRCRYANDATFFYVDMSVCC